MRVFLIILSFLFLIPFQGQSQVQEKDLIGSWLPIGLRSIDDSQYKTRFQLLFTFQENGKAFGRGAGGQVADFSFQYKFNNDSLEWNYTDRVQRSLLPKISGNNMSIQFDSSEVIDFIRLPEINASVDLTEFKRTLLSTSWRMIFDDSQTPFSHLYQFEDHVLDSANTNSQLWSRNLGLRIYNHGIEYEEFYPESWTAIQQGNTIILWISQPYWFNQKTTLLLKTYKPDSLVFSRWISHEEEIITLKKLQKPSLKSSEERLKWLTKYSWRFDSEYIPPPEPIDSTEWIDLGMIEDDFEELMPFLAEGYVSDSTLLISEEDFTNQQLIFDFTKDGQYTILRENRVLDTGKWLYQFSESVIELISSKEPEMSDGVYGGSLQIQRLTKSKLRIYRDFKELLNLEKSRSNSDKAEIYKPIKKRK